MCTGFVKKGKDIICGYNLDVDPAVWNFDVYCKNKYFSVGIKVGSTLYLTHGVTNKGVFANLPYSNDEVNNIRTNKQKERIDLLVDRLIKGKYDDTILHDVLDNKYVSSARMPLHSLILDSAENMYIIEPNRGYKKIDDNYGVIANFPLLTEVNDDNFFYGKERYQKAIDILKKSSDGFSITDGLNLLKEVKQEGQWATRVSFVYSKNQNTVYYCLNGCFEDIKQWTMK